MVVAAVVATGIRSPGGEGVSVRVGGVRVTMSLRLLSVSLRDRQLGWGRKGVGLLLVNRGRHWAISEAVMR